MLESFGRTKRPKPFQNGPCTVATVHQPKGTQSIKKTNKAYALRAPRGKGMSHKYQHSLGLRGLGSPYLVWFLVLKFSLHTG